MEALPYKISTLIFIRHADGRLLLMQRNKAPNMGLWSPIGGKLEMALGESPYEAAIRETGEEIQLKLETSDLHLFSIMAEKNYEDRCHWLMFLFNCRQPLTCLPEPIEEGTFAFFKEEEIATLAVPETDRRLLWDLYFHAREDFSAVRADCRSDRPLSIVTEESMLLNRGKS